jgi:DnaJ-class molecular chaperone
MTISENRARLRLLDSSDGCHMSAPAGDVAAEYAIPPGAKAQRSAGQRTRGATRQINARVEPSLARGLAPQRHQRVEMVRAFAIRQCTMCSGASGWEGERTFDQGRPAGRRGQPLSRARSTATCAVKKSLSIFSAQISACGDGGKVIVDACPTHQGKQQQISEKKAVPVHPAFHHKESGRP